MDLTDFRSLLDQKCALRGVAFRGPEDFFHSRMLAYVGDTWDQWLARWCPGFLLSRRSSTVSGRRWKSLCLQVMQGESPVPSGTQCRIGMAERSGRGDRHRI